MAYYVNDLRTSDRFEKKKIPKCQLKQRSLENNLIFMHDGAPAHWSSAVRQWLENKFSGMWMGRGSPNMPWPPRSPDLTSCDFFL